MVPGMLVIFNQLTQLIACEDFIKSKSRRMIDKSVERIEQKTRRDGIGEGTFREEDGI
jgi:hypothetical protein